MELVPSLYADISLKQPNKSGREISIPVAKQYAFTVLPIFTEFLATTQISQQVAQQYANPPPTAKNAVHLKKKHLSTV